MKNISRPLFSFMLSVISLSHLADDIKRQLEDAIDYLHNDQETPEIFLHTVDGDVRLVPEQIIFVEYKNRKVRNTYNGKQICSRLHHETDDGAS